MTATSVLDLASDPSLFNPLQVQPRAVLSLAFNNCMQWLRDHAMSHGKQVREHRTGWVAYGLHVEYKEPLDYHDADTLSIWGGVRLIGNASQIDYRGGITAAGRAVVDTRMVWAALALTGGEELSGISGGAPPEVVASFPPDAIDPTATYRSSVPSRINRLREEGTTIARTRTPFTVFRHLCEVADQWFLGELVGFAGASRETLVMNEGHRVPLLRTTMEQPVLRMDIVYARPYYLFDDGVVDTEALDVDGRVVLIHRLLSALHGDKPHATVIEEFGMR